MVYLRTSGGSAFVEDVRGASKNTTAPTKDSGTGKLNWNKGTYGYNKPSSGKNTLVATRTLTTTDSMDFQFECDKKYAFTWVGNSKSYNFNYHDKSGPFWLELEKDETDETKCTAKLITEADYMEGAFKIGASIAASVLAVSAMLY